MFETASTSLFTALLQRDTLKALTLTQPWATLVAFEAKRFETRSWLTEYQGPLVIQAAKGFPGWAEDLCNKEPFRSSLEEAGYSRNPEVKHNPWCLPLGPIVAVVWLDGVERITQNYPVSMTERAFGNYAPGRYAWSLSKVYRLTTPIAARGSLGLWSWQPPESFWAEIQAQHEQELGSQHKTDKVEVL